MTRKSQSHCFMQVAFLFSLWILSLPSYALNDFQGKTVQFEQLVGQGRWSVVSIWASDCHICHNTIGEIEAFSKRLPQARVYGISTDGLANKASAQQFIRQQKLSFPNLLASFHELSDYLYANAGESLAGTPTVVVFNPQGKLIAVQPGAVTADELVQFIANQ